MCRSRLRRRSPIGELKTIGPTGPLVQSLPLGLGNLPELLGNHCDVVVRHILKEILDGLLVMQGPQALGGVKVGVAGEQDVVAWGVVG